MYKPYWMMENEIPTGFPVLDRRKLSISTGLLLMLDAVALVAFFGWLYSQARGRDATYRS